MKELGWRERDDFHHVREPCSEYLFQFTPLALGSTHLGPHIHCFIEHHQYGSNRNCIFKAVPWWLSKHPLSSKCLPPSRVTDDPTIQKSEGKYAVLQDPSASQKPTSTLVSQASALWPKYFNGNSLLTWCPAQILRTFWWISRYYLGY